jgi:hypothetical protein
MYVCPRRWETMAELIVLKELKEIKESDQLTRYELVRICGLSIIAEIGFPIKEDNFYCGIRNAYARGELFIDVDFNKQLLTIGNGKRRSFKIDKEDMFLVAKILDEIKYERNYTLRIAFEIIDGGRESWSIYFEKSKKDLQLRMDDCPIPHPYSRKLFTRECFGSYRVGKKKNTSILNYT